MYRLRCFGTMTLEDGGDSDFTLRSRKHWALLVYLLGHRGRVFPRERLAARFWETEPRLARHSLSQALYDIRTTLPGVEFESSTSQVGAGADALAYDGEAFEEAVRADDLRRAVRLYGGRFAPDVEDAGNSDFTRWLESERQRYRRLAEMALYRHVRASHDRGDWGEMCLSALRLLDMNPLNEDAHRALMRGLWLEGDREAAVSHFEDVEGFLARELPGGISRETLDLADRIRTSRPSGGEGPDREDQRPLMVGREEEFEALKRAFEELRDGVRGGLIRVHGEAGMGKTRLLEELRGVVELDGARLLESRCYAAESDVPYGPVVDGLGELAEAETGAGATGDGDLTYYQLGHLFPEAFERPAESRDAFAEPDAGRRRLYEEAADLLRRASDAEPIVWLVEDVHWIDPSSASLLHYLARRLADRPLLLVVTARTHEDTRGAARDLLEDDADTLPRVADVHLRPLEHRHTAELVASAPGCDPAPETADRIHVLAGGNPFYALELLRASGSLEGEDVRAVLDQGSKGLITESLRALLERRVRGLPSEGVRIMETVAVAGRHATSPVVREVTEFSPGRIADLAGALYARGLLRDVDGRLEFFHDITRDFVYGRLGALQRSALHLSVGELLAARDEDVDPATLARHFQEGGERGRAFEHALDAARRAERRHAHDEAIQMAEIAVDLAAGEEDRAEALWLLAKSEYSALKFSSARHHLLQLNDNRVGPVDQLAEEIFFYLASISIEMSQWSSAKRWLNEAEQRLSGRGALEQSLKCLHLQLKACLKASHHSDAARIRDDICRLGEENAGSCSSLAEGLVAISLAAYDLYCESAEAARERLEAVQGVESFPLSLRLTFLQLKGAAEQRSGQFERSRATHQRSFKVASEYNDIVGQLTAVNNLMCESLEGGRLEKAMDYYESVRHTISVLPSGCETIVHLRMNLAETFFAREKYGRAKNMYRKLEHWLREETDGGSEVAPTIRAGLGLCLLATGECEEAADLFQGLSADDRRVIGGVPAADVVSWFQGFMLWQHNPDSAHQFMVRRGREQLTYQEVGGRRILWLASLFSACLAQDNTPNDTEALYKSEPANRLRELGDGWFLRFSKRWLRRVQDHRAVVVAAAG